MRDLSPPAGVEPLPVPVPPMLEDAMGYPRHARWWAMYYAATEASWTDGQSSRCGTSWAAYSTFMNHPAVALVTRGDYLALGDYDFGSDDEPPRHYMLIDSVERVAYVMRAADCETFLRLQWRDPAAAAAPPVRLTDDDLRLMLENFQQAHAAECTPAAVAERMREEHRVCVEMRGWLDRHPQGKAATRAVMELLEGERDVTLSPRMSDMPGRWRHGGY